MPKYVAFLRAINVGGHVVTMAQLRALFNSLEFEGVESFIASGNIIFDSRSRSESALRGKIEKCLRRELGYDVATILRSIDEISKIASYKPFSDIALKKAAALNVGLVAETLAP